MKKHHLLFYVGAYFVVAYVYNEYVASENGFQLPFDLIGTLV